MSKLGGSLSELGREDQRINLNILFDKIMLQSGGYLRRGAIIGAGLGVSFYAQHRFSTIASAQAPEIALSKSEFKTFKLVDAKELTHNTKRYRFAFPDKNMVSGLTTASLLTVQATIDGKEVSRPYTPVTRNSQKGYLDLIIKTYPAPAGVMSRHIDSLKVGDTVNMKGPWQKIEYKKNMKDKIGMIAGGTGITPMLQVAREILDNRSDHTEVSLIFANVTEEDIILRDELDALNHLYPNFKVYYTLDKPPASGWTGGSGYVSSDMIKEQIGSKDDDILVMVCGPKGFMSHVSGDKGPNYTQGDVGGLLKDLNFSNDQVFKF